MVGRRHLDSFRLSIDLSVKAQLATTQSQEIPNSDVDRASGNEDVQAEMALTSQIHASFY